MCVAIPMRVVGIIFCGGTNVTVPEVVVTFGGVSKKIRLDLLGAVPVPCEYLIVCVGFVVNILDACEVEKNIVLLRKLVAAMSLKRSGKRQCIEIPNQVHPCHRVDRTLSRIRRGCEECYFAQASLLIQLGDTML